MIHKFDKSLLLQVLIVILLAVAIAGCNCGGRCGTGVGVAAAVVGVQDINITEGNIGTEAATFMITLDKAAVAEINPDYS